MSNGERVLAAVDLADGFTVQHGTSLPGCITDQPARSKKAGPHSGPLQF
jgi:hypothetical protein